MDGTAILTISASMYSAVSLVVILAVKQIVRTAVKGLEKQMSLEREDRVLEDKELWNAINDHGHKGLDDNNARVTR